MISTLVHSFCFFVFLFFCFLFFVFCFNIFSCDAVYLVIVCFVRLNDQCHVFAVGQTGFLALPQSGVDCEGVDGHRQMLGVHLRETLAARVVPVDTNRQQINHKNSKIPIQFQQQLLVHSFN